MPISLGFWEWGCPKRGDAHITVTPAQELPGIVIYSHYKLITSSRNIKLWEKSATDEAIGMQRGNFKKRRTCQPPPAEVGGSRKAKEFPGNRPLKWPQFE